MRTDLAVDAKEECKYCGTENALKLGFAENRYEAFCQSLRMLIIINEENRETNGMAAHKAREQMPLVEYWTEFCTIRVSAGRRIGKTSLIGIYASERDLVIVRDRRAMLTMEVGRGPRVKTIEAVMNGPEVRNPDLGPYRRIWIDDITEIWNRSHDGIRDRIYRLFGHPETFQTWIFLGG